MNARYPSSILKILFPGANPRPLVLHVFCCIMTNQLGSWLCFQRCCITSGCNKQQVDEPLADHYFELWSRKKFRWAVQGSMLEGCIYTQYIYIHTQAETKMAIRKKNKFQKNAVFQPSTIKRYVSAVWVKVGFNYPQLFGMLANKSIIRKIGDIPNKYPLNIRCFWWGFPTKQP